ARTLAALVRRADCPTHIVADLADDNRAQLRAAYLCRTDLARDARQQLITREKRISVLSTVASKLTVDTDLPSPPATHPPPDVCANVALNPHTPTDVRRAAVVHIDRTFTDIPPLTDLYKVVKLDEEWHNEYAATLTNCRLLDAICTSSHLRADGLDNIIDRC